MWITATAGCAARSIEPQTIDAMHALLDVCFGMTAPMASPPLYGLAYASRAWAAFPRRTPGGWRFQRKIALPGRLSNGFGAAAAECDEMAGARAPVARGAFVAADDASAADRESSSSP